MCNFCGCFMFMLSIAHNYFKLLASERDTIRVVQFRAGAVYIFVSMYEGTCAIIVVHATHM